METENLNRRKFLKLIGISISAPTVLLKAKPLTHPVDVLLDLGFPNNEPMKAMREYCDEQIYYSETYLGNSHKIINIKNENFMCCNWSFRSQECGYTGQDKFCSKSLDNCKAKNNEARFGGIPPIYKKIKKIV